MDKMSSAFDDGVLDQLAELHLSILPDSLISLLGARFVRQFYRYVAGTRTEHLGLELQGDHVIGGYLLTEAPNTLFWRLLFTTDLVLRAPLALVSPPLLRAIVEKVKSKGTRQDNTLPELLLIYVAESHRKKGVGMRLLNDCTARVRSIGYFGYYVRTYDDPNDATHRFYNRATFVRTGTIVHGGRPMAILEKQILDSTELG